jgi:hypothetical protein
MASAALSFPAAPASAAAIWEQVSHERLAVFLSLMFGSLRTYVLPFFWRDRGPIYATTGGNTDPAVRAGDAGPIWPVTPEQIISVSPLSPLNNYPHQSQSGSVNKEPFSTRPGPQPTSSPYSMTLSASASSVGAPPARVCWRSRD